MTPRILALFFVALASSAHALDERLILGFEPAQGGALPQVLYRKSLSAEERSLQSRALNRPTERLIVSQRPLWTHTGYWNADEEKNYARWLREKVDEKFFVGSGLSADCADFALALRWIYSRERGLPAANTVAGDYLFGSWNSTETWDQLPTHRNWKKDERFKAALKYLFETTYTHSVLADLYPVRISPAFVTGGTLILNLWQGSGHTRTITDINKNPQCPDPERKCIRAVYGSEPAAVEGFISTDLPGYTGPAEGGLMRFRWPQQDGWGRWSLVASERMPGYSTEQYDWNEESFAINLFVNLGLGLGPADTYVQMGRFVVGQIFARVQVTAEGFFMCSLVPCADGSDLENLYSTPQRDHRLMDHIQTLTRLYDKLNKRDSQVEDFRRQADVAFVGGLSLSYLELLDGRDLGRLKADPRLAFWARWGASQPSAESRWAALLQAFTLNWTTRSQLVRRALNACRDEAGRLICDPKDESVRALNTSRLDQAFRAALTQIRNLYSGFPQATQLALNEALKQQILEINFCGSAKNPAPCTLWDLLINAPEHVQRMSSDPSDSAKSRYGF